MYFSSRCHRFVILPLLSALVAPTLAGGIYDPDRIGWSRLELEATKFFITARSEVDLTRQPVATVANELIAPSGDTPLSPGDEDSYLIAIRTSVLSQESRVRFLFEPTNARALQRSELSLSKKRQRHRTYRYANQGVHSRTLRPNDGEDRQAYSEWSDIVDKFIAFPTGLGADVVVTEAAALLYAVPAADLDAVGDKVLMHVYSRGQVNPVDVMVAGQEKIRVDYVEAKRDGERSVSQEVDALRVTLRPHLPGPHLEGSSFKLLGLEGDVDLYLDPDSRALLQVTGKIKIAGSVQLQLRRVVLK